jgi:hypothetical protein
VGKGLRKLKYSNKFNLNKDMEKVDIYKNLDEIKKKMNSLKKKIADNDTSEETLNEKDKKSLKGFNKTYNELMDELNKRL